MTAPAGLRTEVDGRVGRLVLDDPARRNPLGSVVLQALIDGARSLDQADVDVIVVSGEGPSFCGGFDLRELAATEVTEEQLTTSAELGAAMADAIEATRAVTIAALHGHCVGGGVVLAGACDLRVAADDTTFRIPEVELGIPLAWGGIPRLVREIGPAATRELVITCRPFDAHEALGLGFVNRVVPHDQLDAAVDELTASILDKPRGPVRTTTEQVRRATAAVLPADPDTDLLVEALRRALAER